MPLDRLTVLRAALAIVDREGVAALSMRRLGDDLGVTAMALYNHVADRTDLLDGVADLVAREIGRPSGAEPPRARLRALALDIRRACLRHPATVPLLQTTGAMTPALLQPAESALAALADAGLDPGAARAGWAALIGLTYGHVTYQLADHLQGPAGGRGSFDPGAFPHIAALDGRPPFDWDTGFADAVDALLDGLLAPR